MPKGQPKDEFPNAGKDFTPVELAQLLNAWLGHADGPAIARTMGRSLPSIESRLYKLAVNYRGAGYPGALSVSDRAVRAGKPWGTRERELLLVAVTGAKDATMRPAHYRMPDIAYLEAVFMRSAEELEQEITSIRKGMEPPGDFWGDE